MCTLYIYIYISVSALYMSNYIYIYTCFRQCVTFTQASNIQQSVGRHPVLILQGAKGTSPESTVDPKKRSALRSRLLRVRHRDEESMQKHWRVLATETSRAEVLDKQILRDSHGCPFADPLRKRTNTWWMKWNYHRKLKISQKSNGMPENHQVERGMLEARSS